MIKRIKRIKNLHMKNKDDELFFLFYKKKKKNRNIS